MFWFTANFISGSAVFFAFMSLSGKVCHIMCMLVYSELIYVINVYSLALSLIIDECSLLLFVSYTCKISVRN